MPRVTSRTPRRVAVVLLAAGLMATAPVTTLARMPEAQQWTAWERQCERAAGTISDQTALVCDHLGEPQWDPRTVQRLVRFCEHALGGEPVVRSQYPLELVACF